jgi:hypothetical protein
MMDVIWWSYNRFPFLAARIITFFYGWMIIPRRGSIFTRHYMGSIRG